MQEIGKFSLTIEGKRKRLLKGSRDIVVEVLIDKDSTHIVIDCHECKDLLKNQLPSGEMIAVVSGMKEFFDQHKMKKIQVSVSGSTMHREYEGLIDASTIDDLQDRIEQSLEKFTQKSHHRRI